MPTIAESQIDELLDAARRGDREVFEALVYRAARLLEEQRRAEFRIGRSRTPQDGSTISQGEQNHEVRVHQPT